MEISSDKGRKLVVLTTDMPFGETDVFMLPELEYLATRFDQITLVPLRGNGNHVLKIPDNVQVCPIYLEGAAPVTWKLLRTFLRFLWWDLKDSNAPTVTVWRQARYNLGSFRIIYASAQRLKAHVSGTSVLYSHWWEEGNLMACILKLSMPQIRVLTRAHGFDLYQFRRAKAYIPFRMAQISLTDQVYCISQHGLTYLLERYGQFKDRLSVHRLGTRDHGYLQQESSTITVMSVSSIRPVKRAHLTPNILALLPFNVTWIHIGGGEEFDAFKKEMTRICPKNVSLEFLGQMDNSQVMQVYQNRKIDVHINLSESEGLPVSIMEACSFGVPTVATNVGGTSEIVNNSTGKLVAPDFTFEEVAKAIVEVIDRAKLDVHMHEKIRHFWEENFNQSNQVVKFEQAMRPWFEK